VVVVERESVCERECVCESESECVRVRVRGGEVWGGRGGG
jgi:hypothetical protein